MKAQSRAVGRSGFTVTELVIVTTIIGVLALIAVPQYLKSIESARADSASGTVQLLATANRMYALDKSHRVAGPIDNTCNSGGPFGEYIGCNLVAGAYVSQRDWDSDKWSFHSCLGASAGTCCATSLNMAACAQRKAGGPGLSSGWGYKVMLDGTIQVLNGAPTPVQ